MNTKRGNKEVNVGGLARDFSHSNHPDLRLFFVYPKEEQPDASSFYVCRLTVAKKQLKDKD